MGDKVSEATKYLYGCLTLEKEVNHLYITATKKLASPLLTIITTSIAYDYQKHVTMIQELLKPLDPSINPDDLPKEFKKSVNEMGKLIEALANEDNIDADEIRDLLKNLTDFEEGLHNFYANFIESKMLEDYSNALLELSDLTDEYLRFILNSIMQENLEHREMLIEGLSFHSKNEQKNKDSTPVIRYQNPDAWVHL
jgi:hypothetical protein